MARRAVYFAAAAGIVLALATVGSASTIMEKVGNYLQPIEAGEIEGADTTYPKRCDVAIVGAGPGGIYTAWRMLTGFETKPEICVFETTNRVGGRIYTLRGLGKEGDMTVDLGAYRYVDGRDTLVQGVIENALKLKYDLYDPNSTVFRKIIDDKGDDLGFVAFVEEMTKISMDLGMKLFFKSTVIKVDRVPGMVKQYALTIDRDGKESRVLAGRVVFNVPQRPLYRILQASNLARATAYSKPLFMPFPLQATKMYLFYEDAWWIYMNKTTGSLSPPNLNNATTFNDSSLFITPPLRGRYHDGDWKCTDNTNTKCHGLFMYTYVSDSSGTYSSGGQGFDITPFNGVAPRYYASWNVNPDTTKPYVVLDASTSYGETLLTEAHAKLVEYHNMSGTPIPEPYASTIPTQAILVVWDPQVHWTGGAWHGWKNGNRGGRVSTNYTDPTFAVPVAAITPFEGEDVHIANEAWSALQGWAEGSLRMAENLVMQLGATRPTFITPERHDCVLHATYLYNTTFCSTSLNPLVQGQVRRSARVTEDPIAAATSTRRMRF